MAESNDAHHLVVEIDVSEDHQKQTISTIEAIQDHPLMEISESPGHLLLLKIWQREEDLSGRKIAKFELQIDSLKSEIFHLCLFFFIFHGFFFTILFTQNNNSNDKDNLTCKKWWVPMIVNLSTCCEMIFLVQLKLCRYWKLNGQLLRERNDSRVLTRCVQELRMKGASFDLSKEPVAGHCVWAMRSYKRMKSSSVEIKWKPINWFCHYLVTICLVGVMGLAVLVI
ncbi:uncharacterized protein [Rutidosis leptorrhynchoides]|uniref:uncharacterized protein n=1 Tax=Rutidosis leptorrhynchoides TaxID=125765 RepID=UPI003A9988F6